MNIISEILKSVEKIKITMVEQEKKPKLGSGERFNSCIHGIINNPNFEPRYKDQTKEEAASAICASRGRAKYGKKRFQELARRGKK